MPTPATADLPFDPATGEWRKPTAPAVDPEAPRRDAVAATWNVILGIDLALLAFLYITPLFLDLEDVTLTAEILAVNALIILVLMGIIPLLWVVFTRTGGLHGALHYLKLERPAASFGRGLLLGIACLFGLALLMYAWSTFVEPPKNPQVEAMGRVMTLPLALFLAVAAAFGEEILFRGVLQKWLGWWGQAILFGALHYSYGVELQVIIPFALGLLFGYLVHRGARLWVPMGAHLVFNLVQFLATIYLPPEGGDAATLAWISRVPWM